MAVGEAVEVAEEATVQVVVVLEGVHVLITSQRAKNLTRSETFTIAC